jgi:hypothetical protein
MQKDRRAMIGKRWLDAMFGNSHRDEREVPPAPPPPEVADDGSAAAAAAGYRALHKYLANRYSNVVVLTFAQIEDLLGFVLPDVARRQRDWWTGADGDGDSTVQSRSWTDASRTATPNLLAQNVLFERAQS